MSLHPTSFPGLRSLPNSGMGTIPWAEYQHGPGNSTFDMSFGSDGVHLGMVMMVNWSDLQAAVVRILGFSSRILLQATSGFISAIVVTSTKTSVVTSSPHKIGSGRTVFLSGISGTGSGGVPNLNGTWVVVVNDPVTFTLCGALVNNSATYNVSVAAWSAPAEGYLSRQTPWQHPYFNQLFAKQITRVQGIRSEGTNQTNPVDTFRTITGGGTGDTNFQNFGPWSEYNLALITIKFWRPPYYVRSDASIRDLHGFPQEFLRYVSFHWDIDTRMLTREGQTFFFSSGQATGGIGPVADVPGSVGQPISHVKLDMTWHEVPQAALFSTVLADGTPQGIPFNLVFTQSPSTNPATGYFYPQGRPIINCVNNFSSYSPDPFAFFGFPPGTLFLDSIRIVERPLHLPPSLMQIPTFTDAAGNNNIPTAQMQYDVVFHFDYFDPPRSDWVAQNFNGIVTAGNPNGLLFRGHNLMPWAGDGLWYSVRSKIPVVGSDPLASTTPMQFADFSTLFKIL